MVTLLTQHRREQRVNDVATLHDGPYPAETTAATRGKACSRVRRHWLRLGTTPSSADSGRRQWPTILAPPERLVIAVRAITAHLFLLGGGITGIRPRNVLPRSTGTTCSCRDPQPWTASPTRATTRQRDLLASRTNIGHAAPADRCELCGIAGFRDRAVQTQNRWYSAMRTTARSGRRRTPSASVEQSGAGAALIMDRHSSRA